MSNAFAPIVRARPCPIFGRPVHQGSLPFDYSPILLLKPFRFRIAPDTLSSGIRRATGSRSVLAVSGFRLRARLDFSIPSCSPGQRGITPAFGYSAPHPSAEGTSTPMIHALPSAHYEPIRLPIAPGLTFTGLQLVSRSRPRDGVSRVAPILVVCVPSSLPRWSCWVPVALFPSSGSFPCEIARSASTSFFFRGLLDVYSHYSPHTRGIAKRSFPSKASDGSLRPRPLRLLPAGATLAGRDLPPLKNCAFPRHTTSSPL